MIEIKNATKRFSNVVAVNSLSCNIAEGTVFGLVGSNGSGKSTLLRMLSGVFNTDGGEIIIDGEPVFDNPNVKSKCFFISDFPFFSNSATLLNSAELYRALYPNWSDEVFEKLCSMFPINPKANIITMSKGMQRQAAIILALSTRPVYLFMDEIFDGLDPVVRQLLKKLLIGEITERKITVIIASHNLRELEDLCDYVGLLHKGGILLEKDLDSAKTGMHKIQAAFESELDASDFDGLEIVNFSRKGKIVNMTVKGSSEEVEEKIKTYNPIFMEALPLTLEELFISEMEAAGYDINNITA